MNINDLGTQLLYTTFPIWVVKNNGEKTFGTGFIYNYKIENEEEKFIPLLITNRHVIKDATKVITQFVAKEGELPSKSKKTKVELNTQVFLDNSDEGVDLAAHPIAPVINQLHEMDNPVFYRTIDTSIIPKSEQIQEFSAIEDITFIGYPSGLSDRKNLTPLIRKGITSTPIWNNFDGQPKFLIDADVYPGSSGSPVFIFNQGSYGHSGGITLGTRLFFVGVISESVISKEDNSIPYFLGLGRVINSLSVLNFIDSITEKIKN